MKRILIISALLLVAALANSASAHEGEVCEHAATGMDFGQHVAEHARAGELGMEHHPGMHQGFSPCAHEMHMPA